MVRPVKTDPAHLSGLRSKENSGRRTVFFYLTSTFIELLLQSQRELLHAQSRIRNMQQISRDKLDRFRYATAGFTTSVLDGYGLRCQLPTRPTL